MLIDWLTGGVVFDCGDKIYNRKTLNATQGSMSQRKFLNVYKFKVPPLELLWVYEICRNPKIFSNELIFVLRNM